MTTRMEDLLIIKTVLDTKIAEKKAEEFTAKIQKLAKDVGLSIEMSSRDIAAAQKKRVKDARIAENQIQKSIQETQKKVREWKANMLGMGMSFLFTGMAVKRMFDTIKKESFSAFNKLTANTDMANNATNKLNMSMDYLKFTLADAINTALEPLLPALVSIIEYIGDWIEKNPELAGKIIVWGSIISGVVMIIGQLALGILGVYSAIALIFGANAANAFLGIKTGAAAAIGSEAAGTGVMGLKGALLWLGKALVTGYSIKLTLDSVKEATSTDDAATQFHSVIEASLGAALAVGFGASLLKFGAGASAMAGGYAFVAVLSIGMLYLFTQTFKKAPGSTGVPNLGDEFDSKVSTTPISVIREREEIFNRVFNDQAISDKMNAQLIETLKSSRQTTNHIDDNILKLNETISNTSNTTNLIDDLVSNQKLINEEITDSAIKTKDNLNILADEEFKGITTTTKTEVAGLATAFNKAKREIERAADVSWYESRQINLLNRLT
ncbi:MAG: hypothetical protein PHY83_03150 [Bacilli bacterium]|nr:hypothetical protein [Bacilli bacterium]